MQARLLPSYCYNFNPAQLLFLCECLEETQGIPGAVVEIGCAAGNSTIFLNKFMDARGIEKEYFCLDTFSGFTEADVRHEVNVRGKAGNAYRTAWKDWSRGLFETTMAFNAITRVKTIEADVNDGGFEMISRIAFCLVDVDLYRPVKASLSKAFERLSPGGIIVVDDCISKHKYDGAREAYSEFVRERGLIEMYRHSKLGIIRTPCVGRAAAEDGAR